MLTPIAQMISSQNRRGVSRKRGAKNELLHSRGNFLIWHRRFWFNQGISQAAFDGRRKGTSYDGRL